MLNDRPLRFGLAGAISGAHVRALASLAGKAQIVAIARFIDAIREDRPPFVSLEDARATTIVIEAIRESARTGRPVRL